MVGGDQEDGMIIVMMGIRLVLLVDINAFA